MVEQKEAVFTKDAMILKRDQKSGVLGVILEGCIHVCYGCVEYDLQASDIIGLGGLDAGMYSADYKVTEDVKILFYRADNIACLEQLFQDPEFDRQEALHSITNQTAMLGYAHEAMNQVMMEVAEFIKKQYIAYLTFCKKNNFKPVLSHALKDVKAKDWRLSNDYIKKYFLTLNHADPETLDSFFMSGSEIGVFHTKSAASVFTQFTKIFEVMETALKTQLNLLCAPSGENLFAIYLDLLKLSGAQTKNMQYLLGQLEEILDFTADVEMRLTKAHIAIPFASGECKTLYDNFVQINQLSMPKADLIETKQGENGEEDSYGFQQCGNNLEKLLAFSDLEEERKQAFRDAFSEYKNLPDKKGQDDQARRARKVMTDAFYELYENVFIKSENEGVEGIVLDLFFNYGLVDETMFSEEKWSALMDLTKEGEQKDAHVYTIKEWLDAIYKGKKEPSKNDLDLDYQEQIRERERKENLPKEETEKLLSDQVAKIHFEIENFVRMNSRLTNGELSVFCPVLTDESFMGNPKQMFVTVKKINDAIDWLMELDYGVFHREKMYDSRENGITNMLINVQVFPDIILMPNTGTKSRMWQEIEGKFRDTPARFGFPAFTSQDLNDLLVQAAGAFRWQMCKRIQGNYWNVVSEKSLTSEYYDYIQFYKKNKDLTDKNKEKITTQLQRARNNFGDCFVLDYALWIKNEVAGSMRLNKIAREILATYCTPTKEYRDRLKRQPMFAEAFSRYERNKVKKVKEINSRRAAIRNANGVETEEFLNEAKFQEET